jgi:hypothetical protein
MRKLFVDDIRNAPDESWTVAKTITAAISAVATFDFDVISLDHDISHQIVMGGLSRPYPCDETFTPVSGGISSARTNRPSLQIGQRCDSGSEALESASDAGGVLGLVTGEGAFSRDDSSGH